MCDHIGCRSCESPVMLHNRCAHIATSGYRTHINGKLSFHVCSKHKDHDDGQHVCDGLECRPRHYKYFVQWGKTE